MEIAALTQNHVFVGTPNGASGISLIGVPLQIAALTQNHVFVGTLNGASGISFLADAPPIISLPILIPCVESYIECGTQVVWVIYPAEKIVDVWRPAAPGQLLKQKLTLTDHLDGSPVLPGLSIPLASIFPAD